MSGKQFQRSVADVPSSDENWMDGNRVRKYFSTRATHKAHVAELHGRHGGKASGHQGSTSSFRSAMDAGLGIVLLKLVVGLVIVLSLTGVLKSVLRPFQQMFAGGAVAMSPRDVMPVPPHEPRDSALQTNQPPPHPVIEKMPVDLTTSAPPTAAEIRESKRKADEAMRILERSTPEM
jgi:hypothetical protein